MFFGFLLSGLGWVLGFCGGGSGLSYLAGLTLNLKLPILLPFSLIALRKA